MKVSEVEIPCPWGHISAKTWGNEADPLILGIHGIMDNAGSFDRLIPLLPPAFYYVCIDLPGHGKSSSMHSYFPIYSIDNLLVYKFLTEYFNREKYIIMGHSYGGQLALTFAQIYPELVEKLILLDSIHLYPVRADKYCKNLRKRFDYIIDLMEKNQPQRTYTYEEAIQRLTEKRVGFITREAAEALLPRGITPVGDGKYEFTVDRRMRVLINPLHDFKYITDTLKKFPVTCPVLMILGRQAQVQQMYMRPVLTLLKKNRNFRIKYVEGPHDVHNNKPEIVAPYVSKFLLMQKGKL